MIFLVVPYLLLFVGIPGLMTFPFYFFNQYLIKKIKPRESGYKLLIYFTVVIATAFTYMAAGAYLIITVAKMLK
jgi:hypothetical protein